MIFLKHSKAFLFGNDPQTILNHSFLGNNLLHQAMCSVTFLKDLSVPHFSYFLSFECIKNADGGIRTTNRLGRKRQQRHNKYF